MDDIDLLRLLVRSIPFVLARPDVGAAHPPGGKEVGARHDFLVGKNTVLSQAFAVRTLGGLARMWANFPGPDCPRCGTRSALVDFGGSFLSGAGKFARWFCPRCGGAFTTKPGKSVVSFGGAAARAAKTPGFVLPFAGSEEVSLPKGLAPRDLRRVFGGRLVEEYDRAALDEVVRWDAMVRDAVSRGRAFSATFRLKTAGGAGEVVFGNLNGWAMLYGDFRGGSALAVRFDEQWGLLPMLGELAERLGDGVHA